MGYSELNEIVEELSTYAKNVSEDEIDGAVSLLKAAQTVFVAGVGRSGFAARGFANRLKHLGKEVYFVGETTASPIKRDDLLVICSGSGTTDSLVAAAHKAKALGAKIITLTVFPQQEIGKVCDVTVRIPGVSPKETGGETVISRQPMGSLFEQMCWLVLDSMILILMKALNQNSESMFARHANLE